MTLYDILADKLIEMHDGESITHEQDGIVYRIIKRVGIRGFWFEYWENGACLELGSCHQVLKIFLGM